MSQHTALDAWIEEQITLEIQKEKAKLRREVRFALATNPHNTFKGTADEYIAKYHLYDNVEKEVRKSWEIK